MKNGKPRNMEKQEKWRKENQEMGKRTRKEKKIRFFKYYFSKKRREQGGMGREMGTGRGTG